MTVQVYTADGRPKGKGQSFAPQGVVCRVYRATAMNMSDGGLYTPDTKEFDPFNFFDIANGRFQPKLPGYYDINCRIGVAAITADNYAGVRMWKNGSASGENLGEGDRDYQRSTFGLLPGMNRTVYLDGKNDYVEARTTFSLVTTPAINTTKGYNFFEATLIGSPVGVAPEPWKTVGPNPSDAVPFATGWSASPNSAPPRFMKDPHGFVHLDGMGKYTSGGTFLMFTLPVGYRPSHNMYFSKTYWASSTWNNIADLYVTTGGAVNFANATDASPPVTDYASLTGTTFRAEN